MQKAGCYWLLATLECMLLMSWQLTYHGAPARVRHVRDSPIAGAGHGMACMLGHCLCFLAWAANQELLVERSRQLDCGRAPARALSTVSACKNWAMALLSSQTLMLDTVRHESLATGQESGEGRAKDK